MMRQKITRAVTRIVTQTTRMHIRLVRVQKIKRGVKLHPPKLAFIIRDWRTASLQLPSRVKLEMLMSLSFDYEQYVTLFTALSYLCRHRNKTTCSAVIPVMAVTGEGRP
ncbi:unnamed protein product [Amoebophrya sp. A25]|nr:unnamed protein product [Amoebophrya sp. A25]|eukprot:GSA25T00004148001.1